MARVRAGWVRVLQLYDVGDEASDPAVASLLESLVETRVHARSRFRAVADPSRVARYSVHHADGDGGQPLGLGEHTLSAVREFRRVPLDASSLALTVFSARAGRAVQLVAALAHFVQRAVDIYQPGYLLLAHSREDPRLSLLLTAVRDAAALGAAASAAFNLDRLLAEVDPLLADPPEYYAYWPEPEELPLPGAVSPYAV
jgi:hypothetical protein